MVRDEELEQLRVEVDSLRQAAAVQEAHLLAVTEEMDAMLCAVEQKRNALAAAHAEATSAIGLLDRIVDTAEDLIIFADAAGRIRRFNRHRAQELGLVAEALIGASLDSLIDAADLDRLAGELSATAILSNGILFERIRVHSRLHCELHMKTGITAGNPAGAGATATIWQLRAGVVLSPQGKLEGVVAIFTDITAWREAEADMSMAASVCQNIAEALMVTDLDGTIVSINPSFSRITGFTADEVVGHNPRMLKSERHDPLFYENMWQSIRQSGEWRGDVWNRRKTGETYIQRGTIRMIPDAGGRPNRYVYVFQDYTDTWQRDEHTRHLAFHDPLTGLANRMLLTNRLSQSIAGTERDNTRPALLFIDLDGFKAVNDLLGHGPTFVGAM